MPLRWAFKTYIDKQGSDAIQEWHADKHTSVQARAKFRSRLRTLGGLAKVEWRRPLFDTLTDDCAGLWEIRFEAGGVP